MFATPARKIDPDSSRSTVAEAEGLDVLLAPVRKEYDEVQRRLSEALTSEVEAVDAVSRYVAKARGKGLRPALVLLTARSVGEIDDKAIRSAVAVELLQTSTLLHDDVIDQATMRRGMPTVNLRWSNSVAVLMGDVLFTRALSMFTEADSIEILAAATRQVRVMIEGEVAGHDLRGKADFDEDTYMEIVRRKTGALLSLSCELGARLAGADEYVLSHMTQFGEKLGTAFQIADDVLDVTGDSQEVGKPTGQDLREGTITLPLIRALRNAPEGETEAIRTRVAEGISSDEEWEGIREFIVKNRGVESALDTARQTLNLAREHLSVLRPSSARQSLQRAINYVIKRKS